MESTSSKERPIIVINFKTAEEAAGRNALNLAKKIDRFSDVSNKSFELIIAVQAQDVYMLVNEVRLKIFAQHVDPVEYGSFTGSICPEAIKECGASGTLLNHPEKRLNEVALARTIAMAKKVGLETLVCAISSCEGVKLNQLNPDYIGIESEKLIGKKDSLLDLYPEVVDRSIKEIKNKVLFGAGIKSRKDIQKVISKGGFGILISSAVVKSTNPEKILEELLS